MNDQRSDDDRKSRSPEDDSREDASAERRATEPEETPETHRESAEPESSSAEPADAGSCEPESSEHEPSESASKTATSADDEADRPNTDETPGTAGETEQAAETEETGGDEGGNSDEGGRRGGGRGLAVFAILLALVVAGAGGYGGWRLYQLEQRVADIPAERAAALEPLATESALTALESRLDDRLQQAVEDKAQALISARDEALAQMRERVSTLEQGVAEIRELAARDQVGWRLAEIRYLLAIAQRRLLIARDTRSAIAALESADRAIAELGSVRLLPLRQRIVEDLADLRSVEPADIEGIALRLQNLLGRVPELSPQRTSRSDATANGGTGSGWWHALSNRLDEYVTVRRRDAGPDPGRPAPATELPEADRLVLALERARQAALARDPVAYERALANAQEALAAGFAEDSSSTARFREAISYLLERPVSVDLPDLGPTIELAERLSAEIESSRDTAPPGNEPADSAPAENGDGEG